MAVVELDRSIKLLTNNPKQAIIQPL